MPSNGYDRVRQQLGSLTQLHSYRDSVSWRLRDDGLEVDGVMAGTAGALVTVPRVWSSFGDAMTRAADEYGVPVELVVATACTESSGNAGAVREEPHYRSDEETPEQVSPGLMQTLISTARSALGNPAIDRAWLLVPENSIRAGTCYLAQQAGTTAFDPPKVAAAYNAGSVYPNDGADNRWKMRQYPIGTGAHVDRFVEWFNDCFKMFAGGSPAPTGSFYRLLRV